MREYLINHEELLSEWDYKKNADVDVSKVTLGSTKKNYWNCVKCGYNWSASMNNRSKGRGCPCCAGKIVWEGHNDLLTINPNLCEEWDYSKNDSLTPRMFTSGSGEKVWWKCRHCDYEWITSINHRNRGEACPCCAGKIVRKGYNDTI